MIIDIHRHMWGMEERYRAACREIPGWREPPPSDLDPMRTAAGIVQEMDGAGVDRSVILLADLGAPFGETPYPIDEENRQIAAARRRYPERLVAFYGTDPRRPGAASSYERAIRDEGVSGLKLHPAAGFFPHDPACQPLYEVSAARRLTVVFHCGPQIRPFVHPRLESNRCHPTELERVASAYPTMTIVVGHAAGDWWRDAVELALRHANVVLELAGWQRRLAEERETAIRDLHAMLMAVGPDRIAFGSDFPGLRGTLSLRDWVRTIQELPLEGRRHGLRFGAADAEAILGGTASRILA